MIFKRAVQRYGRTSQAETPYQRAGQLWDERIGSARVQAKNWRLMAFGCLTLAGGLAAGLVWQSAKSRVTPYVVEVDRLGEPRAVSEVQASYRPTDPQIAWHLSRFIANVRGRSLDPVLVRQNWLEAYDFTTRRGAEFLGDYARGADPFGQIGTRTVSVQVTSVVRASDRSFQVKWSETTYERGAEAGASRWTAILTVVIKPPSDADTLRRNPLGVYVDAVDWSRELEAPTPPRASASPLTAASVAEPPSSPAAPMASSAVPSGSPLDPTAAASTQPAPESRP